ncbi:tetratricopeptide repeat protein [bacterium]|nr:tetratricopeptide repeat protein [bacterium]
MSASNTRDEINKLLDEGQSLYSSGDYKGAIKLYKTAQILSKNIDSDMLAAIYIKLGNAYYKMDDKDKAAYFYEEYLKLVPEGQLNVFSRLAHMYYYYDADKSIDYHNKALNTEINKYDSACKLFAMIKSSFYDQQDIKDYSEYEVDQIRNNLFKNIKKYNHSDKKSKTGQKINVAYLSSDCRAHTMMNYMIPIWENHNKDEFNFFIFNGSENSDSTTERIRKTGFEMIDCTKMSNEQLAQAIYDKNIDILVELSGYTHVKVYSMLYKPAPVIMSYLGYLNTLGMKEVDYIITDKYTIPEDKAYLYTEKPLYLDKGYQIFREKNIPNIEPCPFKSNGYITFGSFNCTSKFNDITIYMWAKILEKVPDSKLFIYRTKLTKNIIKYIKSRLEKNNVDIDRVIFSAQKYVPHYKAYSFADIALDTYPFSGMSIAIETALMGVPTVTLVGEGMHSRGAGRINQVLGLGDLCVTCGEDYINKAAELANDKSRLELLRYSLRKKVNMSDIKQNPIEFTRDLEAKYKQAWNDFINSP